MYRLTTERTTLNASRTPDKFFPAFAELNKLLKQSNQTLKIICVGGYVLQLHGLKTTMDVDAFYSSNAEIDSIIKNVGNLYKLNNKEEVWLNNSVANLNLKPPSEVCQLTYQFENLEVYTASLEYILGMKLSTGRQIDVTDASDILYMLNEKDICNLYDRLSHIGFTIDISVLIDVFERCYGIDWIERYFEQNQERLTKRF